MEKIYVDYDDILCETARSLVNIANDQFGMSIRYEALTAFDPVAILKITQAEADHLIALAHQPEHLNAYRPTHNATMALAQLHRRGYQIHIVTGRPPHTRRGSEKWLIRHQIPFHEIHFVNKYARKTEDYNSPKVITLQQIARENYAFAVEDSAEMALYIAQQVNIPVFLMDRPWNRSMVSIQMIHRCFGWLDMLHKIDAYHRSIRPLPIGYLKRTRSHGSLT